MNRQYKYRVEYTGNDGRRRYEEGNLTAPDFRTAVEIAMQHASEYPKGVLARLETCPKNHSPNTKD